MAKKKDDLKEKLSALKPSVPTSTRAGKAKKSQVKKAKPTLSAPAHVKTPRSKPAVKTPVSAKAVVETPRETPRQEAAIPQTEAPRTGSLTVPFSGMMGYPFMVLDVWRGVAQSCYGLAESQANFLMSVTCWRK